MNDADEDGVRSDPFLWHTPDDDFWKNTSQSFDDEELQQVIEKAVRARPQRELNGRTWRKLEQVLARQELAREQQLAREQLIGPLRMMALLVPQRLWNEEIGDAFELLERLEKTGAPRWQMRLKIWSAVFWVLVNSGRELVSAALGKSKSGSS